ncbi:iron chaperone [Microbacterium sp.]|uniref:iron chaperone n=1 Tax=Microbacterium sp. TaxID=51671 RepID=UPI0039E59267
MGTIDDYLAGLDPDDAAVIAHVYDIAREIVPDAEQGLGYGMPALRYRDTSLLSVMRAKSHFGVYPFSPAAIVDILPLLGGVDHAKGTIRFTEPLPDDTIRALVAARKAQLDL